MRISRRRRHFTRKPQGPYYRMNQQIRAPELRVVDENGEHLGVISTQKALDIAKERGLDLVEISPKANPPAAKILEYGQFKYEKEKETKKQKAQQKTTEVKGVRLSPRIGRHDLDVRKEKAKNFLEKGDKVQVELILRGREKKFANLAKDVINSFVKELNEEMGVKTEQPITRQGAKLSTLISKKHDKN
ncbi:MAG: translation initiation factor IF-3 [Patescibacteria group bacterium]|nr:translation initiation factor IF-3 [Patescibacteria group bacterium]